MLVEEVSGASLLAGVADDFTHEGSVHDISCHPMWENVRRAYLGLPFSFDR